VGFAAAFAAGDTTPSETATTRAGAQNQRVGFDTNRWVRRDGMVSGRRHARGMA
jgi:hypothetical protein